ncbi:MAG: Imm45 family immunity protein [Hyphomonas sp.]
MTFVKLIEAERDEIWAGTVLRFPAQAPFEDSADFMLFFDVHAESGFSLVCTTGSKAGNLEARLPKAALASGKVRAIDRRWLIENWQAWIYPDTSVDQVQILAHYPDPPLSEAPENLATRLEAWTDLDVAAYHVAIALGLMPPPQAGAGPFYFGGRKDLFWTDNPLGNMLFGILNDMVVLGALEEHSNDDTLVRWNSVYVQPSR